MRSFVVAAVAPVLIIALLTALPVFAHVTPNIELQKKGEFVQRSLPGASQFFEQRLAPSAADLAAIKKATGWTPSSEEARIYVGRDGDGKLVGRVILVWVPSEHGPLGLGVAFDAAGAILQVAITDVGSEPLGWVRPLVEGGGMAAFAGLGADSAPDPRKVAPAVQGAMSRYYAKVIAAGVGRAQALERVALAAK